MNDFEVVEKISNNGIKIVVVGIGMSLLN